MLDRVEFMVPTPTTSTSTNNVILNSDDEPILLFDNQETYEELEKKSLKILEELYQQNLDNFVEFIKSQRNLDQFKLKNNLSDMSLKNLTSYKVIRDEFINKDISIIHSIIPSNYIPSLKKKYPNIFGVSKNDLAFNKGNFTSQQLSEIWENIWDSFDVDTQEKILLPQKDIYKFMKKINSLEKKFYNQLSLNYKLDLLERTISEYRDLQNELKVVSKNIDQVKEEQQILSKSSMVILSSKYANDIHEAKKSLFDIMFSELEKTKEELFLKEYEIKEKILSFKNILKKNNFTFVTNKTDEQISSICSICFERSRDRLLPCGHIFCLSCIKRNVDIYNKGKCFDCRKQYSIEIDFPKVYL